MGAPNFYVEDASCVFAVDPQESWEWQDIMDNVFTTLEGVKYFYSVLKEDGYTGDRCCVGKYIAAVYSPEKYYAKFNICLCFKVMLRTAYHQGGNLDYELEIVMEAPRRDDRYYSVAELYDDLKYEYSAKRAIQYEKWITKWVEAEERRIRDAVERVFEMFSDKYVVAASFSNGETMYIKVEEEK